ncbi:disintegrin and metalloproteinase domain-containing protein 9 [Conger conger]|uniref:disintegrin and metalloproteinase domain-containing protein 9 n=1 Tax=Conger conger TaxID=82655 RepID=UPI002A5A97A1|nr:disintegrin and metalloproteinase domain-containing protein 9 [Conger conger]
MSRISYQLLIFSLMLYLITGIKSTGLFQVTSKFHNQKVVIPRFVHDRSKREAKPSEISKPDVKPESLVYSLNIENKDHFLNLKKNKDFVAKAFVQYSHGANGNLVASYPEVPEGCHYHGYVEGHEDSMVALSTCSGLKGVIIFGNQSYGLEPALESTTFEHLLFPLKDSQPEQFVCGVTSEMSQSDGPTLHEPAFTMSKIFRKKRNLPLPRYVELALVVDKMRFDFKEGNTTAVREEMVDLASILDRYYKQLNVHVILVGLEIFEEENPFSVEDSPSTVLSSFVKWRRKSLIPRVRNDVGQLVVGRSSPYGSVAGMAFVGTVCSVASAGGINVFSNNNLQAFSIVVAHEMGHNLGMGHDRSACTCDPGRCIMSSTTGGDPEFSSCSVKDLERLILRGGGTCLRNQPPPSVIITVADCGNGLLEEGEQCDCGTPEECRNDCCDAATCRLTPGSACAQGECCRGCQFRVAGTPCRTSVNTCDLPEFCSGETGFCPEDFYMMDGYSCADDTAYCFEGRCQTYDFQCQHLFGKGAKKADDICFRVINAEGTIFGNCGDEGVKCAPEDSFCGKVQCTDVDGNYPPEGSTITVRILEGHRCVNADFGLGVDVLDPGYVNTGSGCSKGKACMDFKCINASALIEATNCEAQSTCNGHGVCNDQGHCHCDDGWGPPSCNKAGRGGSIDSGPAQIDHSLRDGLLIFFLLVVPLLILIAFVLLYIFKRDWVKKNLFRSRNKPSNPARNGNGATPNPPTQNQPRFQTPHAYPEVVSELPPSYGDLYNGKQYGESGPQSPAHTQGPGVPRPIPSRQLESPDPDY